MKGRGYSVAFFFFFFAGSGYSVATSAVVEVTVVQLTFFVGSAANVLGAAQNNLQQVAQPGLVLVLWRLDNRTIAQPSAWIRGRQHSRHVSPKRAKQHMTPSLWPCVAFT